MVQVITTSSAHPPWLRHDHGITTVDAEYVRPGFASVHLLERAGHVAVIDAGANATVPLVLNALEALGLSVDAVDFIFLTHVHLDHAGGAGQLLQHLPHARVVVHPRGAQHMIDPARLEAGTIAVYGQAAFQRLYGKLTPIPESRVLQTHEGQQLRLGTSELVVLHTPGHALHHQVLFEPDARAVFTGDTFGLSYRELDTSKGAFVVPTTSPTQFDPEQLITSIERIAALEPRAVYLTHYGEITAAASAAAQLREQIEACVHIARAAAETAHPLANIRDALRAYLVQRAARHGVVDAEHTVDSVLGSDIELNAAGLVAWLARSSKHA